MQVYFKLREKATYKIKTEYFNRGGKRATGYRYEYPRESFFINRPKQEHGDLIPLQLDITLQNLSIYLSTNARAELLKRICDFFKNNPRHRAVVVEYNKK